MRITHKELEALVKEAVKAKLADLSRKEKAALAEAASSLAKDILPGSGELHKLSKKVDDFLMSTAEKAQELSAELEDEMKVDMLGGTNPSLAPRIGERNRMLAVRAGVLKKLASNCVSIFEFIRREG
jgi:hypothetical protein